MQTMTEMLEGRRRLVRILQTGMVCMTCLGMFGSGVSIFLMMTSFSPRLVRTHAQGQMIQSI